MIGEWRVAFGDDSAYKHVHTCYTDLEVEGYVIPEVKLASASYMQKPPKFAETKSCFFCAKDFGTFTRRVSCSPSLPLSFLPPTPPPSLPSFLHPSLLPPSHPSSLISLPLTFQHHCRNCGKSICNDCTAEDSVPLPLFGLEAPQRVCLMCFRKLEK